MLNLKEIKKAVEQIAQEKAVNPEKIFEALEASLAAAYKKEYCQKGEVVKAKLDSKTGALKFWKIKTVVDETMVRIVEEEAVPEGGEPRPEVVLRREEVLPEGEDLLPRYNPDRHIFLEEARAIKPDAKLEE